MRQTQDTAGVRGRSAAQPCVRARGWVGVALLSLLGATAGEAPAGPGGLGGKQNRLTNGGFEDGWAGWQPDPKHELVREARQAHGGAACLTGEVTGDKQHLRLLRKVPVSAGKAYEFEAWARATNKTKLVLWIVPPGAKETERLMVEAWEDLPERWQRCTAALPALADGELALQIVAPSSNAAPPGRIWLDDVALVETDRPLTVPVSAGVGYNDEVSLATAADASLYVAWNSFRDGADSLQVARYERAEPSLRRTGAWQAAGGRGRYLLGPKVIGAGDGVYVVYAAEVDRNWDVYAAPCAAGGPGRPLRVSSGAAVDCAPAAAWSEGTLWVAWEANAGGFRRVLLSAVRGGVAAAAEDVSADGFSNYAPSVAAQPGGGVTVAWHSFRQNNFDIYARRRGPDGAWAAERRLTRAPSVDRHARLVPHGTDLWLVYENALMGNRPGDEGIRKPSSYGVGGTLTRRLVVAQVGESGLLTPKGYAQTSPVYRQKAENPVALFDTAGRLWLACRTPTPVTGPKAKSRAWAVSVTAFDGRAWSEPVVVSHAAGMDRAPGLALLGNRLVVGYGADGSPIMFDDEQKAAAALGDVHLATLPCPDPATSVTAPDLEPWAEPREPFSPGEIRVERGEDRPTAAITYNGQRLNLYYGNLHDHTDISQCNRTGDESVDESYANMRDITRCDFACATDHGYNQTPYLWNYTAKLARTNDDPGRFLTFLAEEWTSTFEETDAKHPYGFYGHRNLIFADPYFPRWWNARNRQTPAQVWQDLRKLDANFVQIPHQLADTGNVPTDWDFTDETAQPVAEIFQCRGSYEYKGAPREAGSTTPAGYFLQDAWARGIVIGVIASPDHGGGTGKACVYAPSLTREAILDAIRARHCFGTTAAKIQLDVRVNGHLMGEKIPAAAGQPVQVTVRADCPADVDRVEVCRNNVFVYSKSPAGRTVDLTFTDTAPLPDPSYYYVRVTQKDGETAWSSPVWLGVP